MTMRVIFRCDGCGVEASTSNLTVLPSYWIDIFLKVVGIERSEDSGQLCPKCYKKVRDQGRSWLKNLLGDNDA
jgi:hypothetical protein